MNYLRSFALIFLIGTYTAEASKYWQNKAREDLYYIQDLLYRRSAPAYNKEDVSFHTWHKMGGKNALKLVKKVNTELQYRSVIQYYVNGFTQIRDHLYVRFYHQEITQWSFPGFLLQRKSGKYIIGYVEDESKRSLLNKEVIAIDEQSIADYLQKISKQNQCLMGNASEKCLYAPYILVEQGSVFKFPKTIRTIEQGKISEKIGLSLRPFMPKHEEFLSDLPFGKVPKLGWYPFHEGVWIALPTFNPDEEQQKIFVKLLKALKKFRELPFIIFDLRGNRGGSSIWERPILRNLYGDEFIKSLGDKHGYNKEWIKKLILTSEEKNEKQDTRVEIIRSNIFDEKRNLFSHEEKILTAPKVFLLTDGRCGSSCWLFVREMLQMPNVIQIGDSTASQSLYSEGISLELPSQLGRVIVPTMERIQPIEHIGSVFEPTYPFKGDWSNEEEVKTWTLDIIHQTLRIK